MPLIYFFPLMIYPQLINHPVLGDAFTINGIPLSSLLFNRIKALPFKGLRPAPSSRHQSVNFWEV